MESNRRSIHSRSAAERECSVGKKHAFWRKEKINTSQLMIFRCSFQTVEWRMLLSQWYSKRGFVYCYCFMVALGSHNSTNTRHMLNGNSTASISITNRTIRYRKLSLQHIRVWIQRCIRKTSFNDKLTGITLFIRCEVQPIAGY